MGGIQNKGANRVNSPLDLNISKIKKPLIDFRRSRHAEHSALCIQGKDFKRAESFKFLGVRISANPTGRTHLPSGGEGAAKTSSGN